jgi:MinD-like ATPase involved in chromosome partitioning or flagellar assembly
VFAQDPGLPSGSGFPPSPLDDPGASDRGRVLGPGSAEGRAPAEQYQGPTNYDPFGSAKAYRPEAYSPPGVYSAPDYGPSADYDPADPFGPADAYGPEAYATADFYSVPDSFVSPDAYGLASPPLPRVPAQPSAPPRGSGPAAPAPPRGATPPASAAPPATSIRPGTVPGAPAPPRRSGPGTSAPPLGPAPPGPPGPPPAPAELRAAGAHSAADPASAPGSPVPPAGAAPGVPGPAGATGTAEADAPYEGESPGGLTPDFLLPGRRRAPAPGWRRVIYRATGGLMRVPSTAAELRRRDMINRVRTPVAGGHHRVAVLSLKGGVGKTTTTVGLGATLASLRGDRVIAVDANPDRGTLSDKVRLETAATVRDLLNERGHIRRYADVRTFTSQAPSRLEVLASDRDPTMSVAFSDQDYSLVARVLEHYYSICITDCGTGLLHSAMAGVLRLADQIVLVSSPSVDGARSASATLDWLAAHSYGDLVHNAVVVLSVVRPRSRSSVDLNRLEEHFAARCRAVIKIPYDSHLEEGAEVELDLLSRATADAYLALAAVIGDGLAMPARARRVWT